MRRMKLETRSSWNLAASACLAASAAGGFLIFRPVPGLYSPASSVPATPAATFWAILAQIAIIDIVFSLDSVITAVGMANDLTVMVTAVVLAVAVMMFAAEPISHFTEKHPTIKILALSFLLLIGFSLVADGAGQHVSKGYIYFAMGFSVFVEVINIRVRDRHKPVELRQPYV